MTKKIICKLTAPEKFYDNSRGEPESHTFPVGTIVQLDHDYDRAARLVPVRNGRWTARVPVAHLRDVNHPIGMIDVPEPQPDEQVTLTDVYTPDGVQYDFEALRDFFRRGVVYALPHATGSVEGWRTASVEQLAAWMADYFTAGVTPTLSNIIVKGGVKVARQIIDNERAKEA